MTGNSGYKKSTSGQTYYAKECQSCNQTILISFLPAPWLNCISTVNPLKHRKYLAHNGSTIQPSRPRINLSGVRMEPTAIHRRRATSSHPSWISNIWLAWSESRGLHHFSKCRLPSSRTIWCNIGRAVDLDTLHAGLLSHLWCPHRGLQASPDTILVILQRETTSVVSTQGR